MAPWDATDAVGMLTKDEEVCRGVEGPKHKENNNDDGDKVGVMWFKILAIIDVVGSNKHGELDAGKTYETLSYSIITSCHNKQRDQAKKSCHNGLLWFLFSFLCKFVGHQRREWWKLYWQSQVWGNFQWIVQLRRH